MEGEQLLWAMQSTTYKGLPRFEGNPRKSMPIPDSKFNSFHSDFIGKTLDELDEFLDKSPEDLQIERDYFVVVDAKTKERGKMLLCKREEGKVACYRKKIDDAGLDIGNFWRVGMWEDMMGSAKEEEEKEEERKS
jgi:hypothetical protein